MHHGQTFNYNFFLIVFCYKFPCFVSAIQEWDDEDEHFTDLPDPDDKEIEIKKKVPILKEQKAKQSQSSWVHMSNVKSMNEIIHFFF